MNEAREQIVKAFLKMKLRPVDAEAHLNERFKDWIVAQIRTCPAFALPDVKSPTVICGFFHSFGSCTAWMVTGEGFEASAHHVLPMQRQLCKTIYAALRLHRMDIEVDAGRKDAAAWAERLGFDFEYLKKRAGTRAEDLLIYLWPEGKVP